MGDFPSPQPDVGKNIVVVLANPGADEKARMIAEACEDNTKREKDGGFGALSRYANPALWDMEAHAWTRAAGGEAQCALTHTTCPGMLGLQNNHELYWLGVERGLYDTFS